MHVQIRMLLHVLFSVQAKEVNFPTIEHKAYISQFFFYFIAYLNPKDVGSCVQMHKRAQHEQHKFIPHIHER